MSVLRLTCTLGVLCCCPALPSSVFGQQRPAPQVEDVVVKACKQPARPTWGSLGQCWREVMAALDAQRNNPAQIIAIQLYWESVWTPSVGILFPTRQVSGPNPDLTDTLVDELNPVKLARDAAIDAAAKKYAPKVVLWAWRAYNSTPAAAISAFLSPIQVVTDYQELEYFDVSVNKKALLLLDPFLDRDWRRILINETNAAVIRPLSPGGRRLIP
jgi:hypothetical protein